MRNYATNKNNSDTKLYYASIALIYISGQSKQSKNKLLEII